MAVPVEEIIRLLNEKQEPVILLGDGVPVYEDTIRAQLTVPFRIAPAHLNAQRAGAAAVCAMDYVLQGKTETAAQHRPDYLRVSQAEREREERLRAENKPE